MGGKGRERRDVKGSVIEGGVEGGANPSGGGERAGGIDSNTEKEAIRFKDSKTSSVPDAERQIVTGSLERRSTSSEYNNGESDTW